MRGGSFRKQISACLLFSIVWLITSGLFGMTSLDSSSSYGSHSPTEGTNSYSTENKYGDSSRSVHDEESSMVTSVAMGDSGVTTISGTKSISVDTNHADNPLFNESAVNTYPSNRYTPYHSQEEVNLLLCKMFWIHGNNSGISCPKKLSRRAKGKKPKLPVHPLTIDRIYYINLDKRFRRRALMESWLSQQPIPYERVSALTGEPDICSQAYLGQKCIGVSGLVRTNVHIIDHLNTTGLTLVLEDDIEIREMDKLLASIHLVPPDWDVLRWDCWEAPFPGFEPIPLGFKAGPMSTAKCETDACWYCGGTHAVLWKGGESVQKLKKVWTVRPHFDVDCRLTDPSIKSYCIQIGIGRFRVPESELTDINVQTPGTR